MVHNHLSRSIMFLRNLQMELFASLKITFGLSTEMTQRKLVYRPFSNSFGGFLSDLLVLNH